MMAARFLGSRTVYRLRSRLPLTVGLVSVLMVVAGGLDASPALATSPWLHLTTSSLPTNLPPGGEGEITVLATNLGDAPWSGVGDPIRITENLPPGLKETAMKAFLGVNGVRGREEECVGSTCEFEGTLPMYEVLEAVITVKVEPGAHTGEVNEATVTGGGLAASTIARPITVSSTPAEFGIESYEVALENEGGSPDTRAGSHPFQLTSTVALNQTSDGTKPPALAKDLAFKLPAGLIGNPTPFPQCSNVQFTSIVTFGEDSCPTQTAVGVAVVTIFVPLFNQVETFPVPVFNLVPNYGEPARFGFYVLDVPVWLDTSVRSGRDYGITVNVNNISQSAIFSSSIVTLWGVPGDPRHNSSRGTACIDGELLGGGECESPSLGLSAPFIDAPTSCTGPLQTSVETDSWKNPGVFTTPFEPLSTSSLDSCNKLGFNPEISVTPDVSSASSPSGLTVKVHVPQDESLVPSGLAESNVRSTTVTLPAGVALNPAGADGLEACSESQIGFEGLDQASETNIFTSGLPTPFCPDGAKIGTVHIKTPLLPDELTGAVYLASPAPNGEAGKNPSNALVAMYIVAEDPVAGVLVKLPGEVHLDAHTGQLVATFRNTPQVPFEDLKLEFFGGSRAPLGTPAFCGGYTTTSSITPWSGNAPVEPSSTFNVTSGPNGSPCQAPLPFAPSLTAETTSIQAGGFSPFTMTMSREDGQQNLKAIQLHMPPGLLGTLSSVKLCGEPQADQGTCGPESLMGETVISVGLGGSPFTVTGGKVYITGPYNGAPFGLSIVNPAKAGPFDLGQVVVRAKIEVDPTIAALTITTDTSGPYAIPPILDGIPLEIKHVAVTINRPEFTFNPTNCNKTAITGALTSTEDATSALAVPFQITNCAVLGFKPQFAVSTAGKTSRTIGASLDVKLTYPKAPFGSQANIARVKVELPKQLPSRLSTLQKACTSATFDANPANCPAASRIGMAKAITPIVPVPLEGPAYFVSNGSAKFPELIVVLQGYSVTVYLHGETFISKAGITSSTFATVPDVPIGSFELDLPQGPDSALASNGNLCASKLLMPTEFSAQNGAIIKQNTKIAVTGCKPALKVVKHKSKGKKATVIVSVPSAGRLVASGSGFAAASKSANRAGNVSLSLALSTKERAFLAQHQGRQLAAHIKLRFTPARGRALSGTTMVLLK